MSLSVSSSTQAYTGLARRIQDAFRQQPAQAQPAVGRPHVQPLHLAGVGVVHVVQRAQGAAAGQLPVHMGRQQNAARRGVVTRQIGKFRIEPLETQVHTQ
jgi:hypothetical protein